MSASVTAARRRPVTTLPDGRALAWSEWGPEDGTPVLFCTGAATSGALGFGADVVDGLGIRLIAIDRPGLGRSDPDPGKSFASWTADVAALIGATGIAAPRAVGFSQGAPFALALAAAGLVAAVAVVSGQDELAHPDVRPLLAPEIAGFVASVEADPAGVERFVATSAGPDWMWDTVLSMSGPEDRAVYEAEPFRSLYRAALGEGFARGGAGYARDLTLALGRWPFAPEAIGVPVDLWFGRLDQSPVHAPDLGSGLARRLPRSRLTVDPEAGGAVLWRRAGDILAALAAR